MIWFLLCKLRQRTGIRWPHWLYEAYLNSETWQHKRKQVLERACKHCDLCFDYTIYFEVHHLTYENLGAEPLDDLAALCKTCHKAVHNIPGKEIINVH